MEIKEHRYIEINNHPLEKHFELDLDTSIHAFVGHNASGKSLALKNIAEALQDLNLSHEFYSPYGNEARVAEIIETIDKKTLFACIECMCQLTQDIQDDVKNFISLDKKGDTPKEDIMYNAYKITIRLAGSGYKKIFEMIYICITKSPEWFLIDNIETSLHPLLLNVFIEELASTFKHINFVITSHSPEIIDTIATLSNTQIHDMDSY